MILPSYASPETTNSCLGRVGWGEFCLATLWCHRALGLDIIGRNDDFITL